MTTHRRKKDEAGKLRLIHGIKSRPQLVLILTTILITAAIIVAAAPNGCNAINSEANAVFEDKWQCSVDEGEFFEVELPSSKSLSAGSHITLKNHLPTKAVKGATVLMRTSQQDVTVAVNEIIIYSSHNKQTNAPAPSSAYHFVRLPNECEGQSITVTLSSPFENYAGFMSEIYIGSKASNIFFLISQNGLKFIIGFMVFSIGVLLAVMFMFVKEQQGRASVTNLGAFFACAGYWVMVESRMMQFIIPYPVALTNSSIFSLSLLPVFYGMYYYNTNANARVKTVKYVLAAAMAASVALALAACANPMLPLRVLPIYLALMMLYLIWLFASIFRQSAKSGSFLSTSVCGMLAFCACALIELALYLSNVKAYNQSNFLTVGLLLFSVFMVVDSIQNFTKVYQAAIRVDTLSVLAYTDSLTGLKNRTAFLDDMSAIDERAGGKGEAQGRVTIAMYDVNDLKVVNDNMGHLAGDALLLNSAKAIQASLRQGDAVYRIGGDEFVAILRHEDELESARLEERLLEVVQAENRKSHSYTLSIAYGFATFTPSTDKTLLETQARADENMYMCKKQQKSLKCDVSIM